MKALALTNSETPEIGIVEMDRPTPGPGQVLVKMKAAALNRRDLFISQGKYPGLTPGTVLGSDGTGHVEWVHDKKDIDWEGEEVIINPNVAWGDNPEVQSPKYRVLGMPDNGAFSEYMVVDTDRLCKKPAHLTKEEAAALPLCGLTAYRALYTHGRLTKKHKILITGIGGGVSQMAMKFALNTGAEVYVTSGDEEKINKSKESGAKDGFNYKEPDWDRAPNIPSTGFDVILDSAGGESMNSYIRMIAPGGKIVFYGSTTGKPRELDLFRLFWKQATLQGSTMGNDQEFQDMVEFVNQNQIVPQVDRIALFENIQSQFDRMRKGEQFGKLVVVF